VPVTLVVVDRQCPAQDVAARHGVDCQVVERDSYGPDFDRDGYCHTLTGVLDAGDTDLVVMAGFGTVLTGPVFAAYRGRILNTHPALLPAFKGWRAVEAALAAGVKVTGCTVHVATESVDDGPILAQEAVEVLDGDTVETLHERIKGVERRLYVATVLDVVARGGV
jgi:phosphoribosylglycinamide formyltransferase-1